MSTQTTTWVYTAEQKEQWDKQRGTSGYHQVFGEQAYTYLVHTIARLVDNPDDPKTALLIGTEEDCCEFLQEMVKRDTIDSVIAYSDDVDGRFQRDVNGHSGHVNKVGAQRRWDYNHARHLRD